MRKEHIFWDRSVVLVPYAKSFKSKRYVPLRDRMRSLLRVREPRYQSLDLSFKAVEVRTLNDDLQIMESDRYGCQSPQTLSSIVPATLSLPTCSLRA
jgi:hypothetical protein